MGRGASVMACERVVERGSTMSVRDRQTGSGMAFRSGDLTDTSR